MKYLLSVISLFPLLVFGVEHRVVIDVFNNSDYSANDAPVVIDLNNISGLSFNVEGAAVYDGINSLPCQLDDTDDDGMNDELCFLYSLESHIRRPITLILTDCKSDYDYPSQVYADMMLDDKKPARRPKRIPAPGPSFAGSVKRDHPRAASSGARIP